MAMSFIMKKTHAAITTHVEAETPKRERERERVPQLN
jgi:hypothetical protein